MSGRYFRIKMFTRHDQSRSAALALSDGLLQGEFVGGRMHGFGTLAVHNGDKYTGEFANNLMHGKGLFEYAAYISIGGGEVAAARYEGHYVRGRKEGQGVFQMRNGDVYSGAFENDLFHGEGILKKANGDTVKGPFLRGKPHGKCSIKYANGDCYEGHMSRGVYSGDVAWRMLLVQSVLA